MWRSFSSSHNLPIVKDVFCHRYSHFAQQFDDLIRWTIHSMHDFKVLFGCSFHPVCSMHGFFQRTLLEVFPNQFNLYRTIVFSKSRTCHAFFTIIADGDKENNEKCESNLSLIIKSIRNMSSVSKNDQISLDHQKFFCHMTVSDKLSNCTVCSTNQF